MTAVQVAWSQPRHSFSHSFLYPEVNRVQVSLPFLTKQVLAPKFSKTHVWITKYTYLPWTKTIFCQVLGKIISYLFRYRVLLWYLTNIAKHLTSQSEASAPGSFLWVEVSLCIRGSHLPCKLHAESSYQIVPPPTGEVPPKRMLTSPNVAVFCPSKDTVQCPTT